MTLEEFKHYHSETVMFCQLIEHDLKWIFSYMHKGNQYDNYDRLEKKTLGSLIQMLRDLDNSDGKPFISNDDYDFLKQMSKKRNYWCHQCAVDFVYVKNFTYSKEYSKVCDLLRADHDNFERVSKIVEEIRLEAIEKYKR